MEDQYYDIERRTAIKEEARMFRRKFISYEQAELLRILSSEFVFAVFAGGHMVLFLKGSAKIIYTVKSAFHRNSINLLFSVR